MSKCLVSGSFDPITNGHLDIIRRASSMFDTVIVGVFNNEEKEHMFNLNQRVYICKVATTDMKNVHVFGFNDMLYEVCAKNKFTHIVRGFRDNKDYAYETEMAVFNFKHCGAMTCLLPSDKAFDSISSSKVRELLKDMDNSSNELKNYIDDERVLGAIKREIWVTKVRNKEVH